MVPPVTSVRDPVLVGEGALPYAPESSRDPLVAWIDLMEVVEALCPRWPERPPSIGRIFLL